MIEAAENVAREFGIARERQDAFTLESHALAVDAQKRGRIAAEMVPLGAAKAEKAGRRPARQAHAGAAGTHETARRGRWQRNRRQ